ncbi:hypothetical protein FIV42_15080 [Persicimonas caeni]|jgi:desulfoferrodoxin (superoxide reductase-like protein)|uniref:Desulfoferrodoxin ferrous iron-binding domain-containing protein n=1 Tax=Persicimonas caeni TaxID=2292766 RepID=A0A4Y6PW98_PERCE|nr:hypothetical protein [Persicimonas caeni]QDG52015.1 hypothetical protein FIV42_15080 [Persicimonas caeni]QED33236.1 hypothetical protein FRD00_15075 [Persicimonas caeni]
MSDSKKLNRREAIKRMGIVSALTLSVPATLWGCGDSATDDSSNGGVDEYDKQRVKALEEASRKKFYSAADPDVWEGKAGSHVPAVTFVGGGIVEVFTNHEMTVEHHINAHYIKDADTGEVLGLTEYSGLDAEARTEFTLPAGVQRIIVHSCCNQHENWVADEKDVS